MRAASCRQRDARNVRADLDEAVLQKRVMGLGIRAHSLQVVEILTRHVGLRIVPSRKPSLRQMRLLHIVGSSRPAHFRRHPARLE